VIYFEIAVAAPLEQTLTYAFTDEGSLKSSFNPDIHIGRRVLVPLGRRKVVGYVVGKIRYKKAAFKIKNINTFLDNQPLFHHDLVPFFRWLADYYHYPLGLVIKAALPAGLSKGPGKKLVLKKKRVGPSESLATPHPEWLQQLFNDGVISFTQTKKILGDKTCKKLLNELIKDGIVAVENVFPSTTVREKVEKCYMVVEDFIHPPFEKNIGPEVLKECCSVVKEKMGIKLLFSEVKALYTLYYLSQERKQLEIPIKDLITEYSGARKGLLSLSSKGLVKSVERRVYRTPFGEQLKHYPRPKLLTAEQQEVLAKIIPAITTRKFKPFLLHGVTGCGKTEVYLRAAEKTLALGRDVLILVPEIALATQLEAHLISRFGELVVLQHSGMSPSEKFDQFHLALSGKAKVVIGARSALFAPLKDPGLIVVDEEHDGGYKQDDTFRYHGRDIAVLRAKYQNCVVILGSATPSIISYSHAESKKYTLLSMASRVGEKTLPGVTVTDLNSNESKLNKSIIKRPLYEKMVENLDNNKQTILLLNRRGFATVLLCGDCGTPVQCNHCHVSLTFHKGFKKLICHYCGFSVGDKRVCLECRSDNLVPSGFGTERVEEEVTELFPRARVRRIDSDTASDRKKFMLLLKAMHNCEIDILIGTQMIAKGHHFPNVTLVGVVWADGGMSMPDFRAAERTFQLITQVIGRAGRGEEPGRVIIQSMRPDHYAIIYAQGHRYLDFYRHEMKLRKHPAFPPYVRLISLRIQGKIENDVKKSAQAISRFARTFTRKNALSIEILGPAPSPLDKIKDKYRWQVLLKGKNTHQLHTVCNSIKGEYKNLGKRSCELIIDVDPENMM